jgi:hypothetical protein
LTLLLPLVGHEKLILGDSGASNFREPRKMTLKIAINAMVPYSGVVAAYKFGEGI